jgi:short-subunit dehydrogenase
MTSGFALVTGASKGLGKVFAESLAARKKDLVLVARSGAELSELAERLESQHGISTHVIEFDLARTGAGSELVEILKERSIGIDLLINNAGFGERGEFFKMPLDRQLAMLQLHNASVVELTYGLVQPMIVERKGSIINVSSSAAFQAIPYATVYAATKAFLSAFSIGLEIELGQFGIKIVTLCPGQIRKRSRRTGEQGTGWKWPDGKQDRELVVASALAALDSGGGLVVPGLLNKFTIFAQRFIPRSAVPKITGKLSRPKG